MLIPSKNSRWFIFIVLLFSIFRLSWAENGGIPPKVEEINGVWEQGNKSKAEKMVDRWKSEDKKSPWPWILAGRFQFEEKRFKKGLSLLNTALEKSPQAAPAYYWRGRCYEAQGKDLDAANEYRAAIISQESYPEAQQALDLILAKLGSASSN